ncbi:MAG TPA: carbonic anhydrase family protein [Candidatus Polarisedimenticolaceae bacterium]|nr:carbonic anhydrase family protein [Candidatus Polarisedimenticolaceae bacterium]
MCSRPTGIRCGILLPICWLVILGCGGPPPEPAEPTESAPAEPAEPPHWDYGTEHGPSAWGELSPDYAACGTGRSQSPIDISASVATGLPALAAQYRPVTLSIVHQEHKADEINTGHTIQVNYPAADTLTVGDEAYALVQYHFHSPSEHAVAGRHFPMEMHLVHRTSDGKLAVVGVFIAEGAANPAFDPVWANLPAEKGDEQQLEHVTVDVDRLLPADRTTYRYDGSLTTPPCSEGVKWFVMTTPIEMSAEQIGRFRAIVDGNNRPVQPLNGRAIATDAVGDPA